MKCRLHGFTLLEVLIALAMLAIVLTAAFRGINLTAIQAGELGDRHMAQWVAQNRMAETRMMSRFPDAGTTEGKTDQGGRTYVWRETVRVTDNPLFRRIEIKVFDNDNRQLASLLGFASRQ